MRYTNKSIQLKKNLSLVVVLISFLLGLFLVQCDEYTSSFNIKNSLGETIKLVSVSEFTHGLQHDFFNVPPPPYWEHITLPREIYGEEQVHLSGITESNKAIINMLGKGYEFPANQKKTIEIRLNEEGNPAAYIAELYQEQDERGSAVVCIGETLTENGELTDSMKARMHDAYDLIIMDLTSQIFLTGGNAVNNVTEAEAMYAYLVNILGANSDNIILDTESSTYVEKITTVTQLLEENYYRQSIVISDRSVDGATDVNHQSILCGINISVQEGRAFSVKLKNTTSEADDETGDIVNKEISALNYILYPWVRKPIDIELLELCETYQAANNCQDITFESGNVCYDE